MSEGIQKGDFSHASPKPIINIVQKCIFVPDTLCTNKKSLAVFNFMQAD